MITSILNALKFCFAVLSPAALLLWASIVLAASAVEIAPGLEVTLPTSLVIDVLEAQDHPGGPVIAGEIGGEPGYFIAATKVSTWEQNNVLWKKLEAGIRSRSANRNFVTGVRGSFTTAGSDAVWFRAYQYESADQNHRQVYFLLKGERNIFWITVTMVEGVDTDLIIPIVKALLRRARFIDS